MRVDKRERQKVVHLRPEYDIVGLTEMDVAILRMVTSNGVAVANALEKRNRLISEQGMRQALFDTFSKLNDALHQANNRPVTLLIADHLRGEKAERAAEYETNRDPGDEA